MNLCYSSLAPSPAAICKTFFLKFQCFRGLGDAVTNDHRQGGLNKKGLLLTVLVPGKPKVRMLLDVVPWRAGFPHLWKVVLVLGVLMWQGVGRVKVSSHASQKDANLTQADRVCNKDSTSNSSTVGNRIAT